MLNLLIIGVNGFIGKHCLDYFSRLDDLNVIGADITDSSSAKTYYSLNPFNPDFSEIFEKEEINVCINCSGAANVPMSLDKPFTDFELNTLNVFKILNTIKKYRPNCKFLNLSSAAVYGNPKTLPIKEDAEASPVSPYGYHKLMAEMICEEFHRVWNIPTLSLRIFSAYGPGLKKQIFWDLSQKLKTKPESIQLFGTGKETRDFIYITDLVRLVGIIINKADFNGGVMNAATGIQSEISDIADIAKKEISPKTLILFNGHVRKGDPLNWEAEISEISSLGFKPKVQMSQGIKKYVEWLKENGLL